MRRKDLTELYEVLKLVGAIIPFDILSCVMDLLFIEEDEQYVS